MRAIFMIPSRPPATLSKKEKFSAEFNDFISKCLTKDPKDRPSAVQLLLHPFVKSAAATLEKSKGTSPVLAELVTSSMDAIRAFRERDDEEDDEDGSEEEEEEEKVSRPKGKVLVWPLFVFFACASTFQTN
jgi:serine/threonine kinase 3